MSDALYSARLKELAARPDHRLERPSGSATADNPLCGDRVTIEVSADGAIGHAVKGCLLCRAAAAAVAELGSGLDWEQSNILADSVKAMLGGNGDPPSPLLEPFLPVRQHRSRHSCVQLPFNTLVEAHRPK